MIWQSSTQKIVLRVITIGLVCGIISWTGLLMEGAHIMQNRANSTEYLVQIGPLLLSRISKHMVSGGFNAGITIEGGLLWYLFGWLAAGTCIGLGLAFKRPQRQ